VVTAFFLLAVGSPHSILLDESFRVGPLLQEIPSAHSYGHMLEYLVQPAIFSLEESAGFSDTDPAKFSIYGDSWAWNQWTFDGFVISDPVFDGAAAFRVPFRLLDTFEVVYAGNPKSALAQGIALTSNPRVRKYAGVTLRFPDAGGTFPLARPIVGAISGQHAEDRATPPPGERRRFGDGYQLAVIDRAFLPIGELTYALEIDDGTRRFLDFTEPDGAFASVFEEKHLTASTAAILVPDDNLRLTLLAEYAVRDRAFAELHYDPAETFEQETFGIMLGAAFERLRVGVTLKRYHLEPNQREFTRELFDPDGEALSPFHPGGVFGATRLDISYVGDLVYLALANRFVTFTPDVMAWTNPVTAAGASYGDWSWRSAPTSYFLGEERLGIAERLELGGVVLSYDFSMVAAYAANRSRTNAVTFFDVALETELELDRLGAWRPFLLFAKTPIAPTTELAQRLDPLYLDGELRLDDGRLIDTTGGAHVRVDSGLGMTNVWCAATGVEFAIAKGWTFSAQGILKTYRNTYRYRFDGDATDYGTFVDGVFFEDDGEKRYVVDNVRKPPIYFGAHFGLVGIDPKQYFLSIGFSAYNAIGRPGFGNGPLANDIGLVDPSTANPNSAINQEANLDSDRGFHFKALLGWRFFDLFWTFLSIRHRDGQPFAFIDSREHEGQIALVQSTKRGSPLKLDRPLEGPREDFHLDFTLEVVADLVAGPLALRASLLAANLFDFGNEIQETNGPLRPEGRAALEQQIPRSFLLTLEATY
jgi:hypothetical protein